MQQNCLYYAVFFVLFNAFIAEAAVSSGYAGMESCRECHQNQYNTFTQSSHRKYVRPVSPETVIGDFVENNTLEAGGQITRMSRKGDRFFVTTTGPDGELKTYPCDRVVGFYYKQRYTTQLSDGRYYVLPVQWNNGEKRWVDYHGLKKEKPGSGNYWSDSERAIALRCAGCHHTGVKLISSDSPENKSIRAAEHAIGCEACHGPAAEHVRNPEKTVKQVSLKQLSQQRLTDVCGRCHGRGKDPANKTAYPYGFQPGERLVRFFDLAEPEIGKKNKNFWPDGRALKHHQQYTDFIKSTHFTKAGMTCMSCHDPHGGAEHGMLKKGLGSEQVCLGCHGNLAEAQALQQHTRHDPKSTGSQCVSCHMPRIVTNAVPMQLRHHGVSIPNPMKTIVWKSPNACSACHSDPAREETPQKMAEIMKKWGVELIGIRFVK